MTFSDLQDLIRIRCGRRKVGDPTLNSQPGAHTGSTRKYIPGYSDANIIYRAPTTGSDSNDGLTELTPKQTKSACDTAAGSTKKIRIIEACTLNESVSKPTEMKRGVAGSLSSSLSAPVDTWTQAGTPSFSTTAIEAVAWSPLLKIYLAVGQSGKVGTSPDGDIFTQQTAIFSSTQILDVTWSSANKAFYCGGQNGNFAISQNGTTFSEQVIQEVAVNGSSYNINCVLVSDDGSKILVATNGGTAAVSLDKGVTWESCNIILAGESYLGGCWSERLGKFFLTTSSGNIYASEDGLNLAAVSAPSFSGDQIYWIVDSESVGKLVAVGGSFSTPKIAYSTDGNSFTQAATPALSGARANYVEFCEEIGKYVAVGNGGQIAYSSDGDTWTLAGTPSFSTTAINDASYSTLLGKLVAVGGSGKIALSTSFANTISASIAGFTVQAMQYSGTVTAYNCTFKQPGTTAILATDSCRFTESGAHISSNTQAHFGTLVEGDFNITGVPASQNAIAVNCCTIAGLTSLFNSSSTTYEQFRDNIMDGGFNASYATIVQSGNLRGTNTNGLLSKSVRFDDPGFVDTTDYKLKRKTQGDAIDSPLVAAASYYVNEQGEQRDIGAWSLDDSALEYDYSHTFFVRKPAGQGIKPKKVPMASADQGIDGEWDATNEPARASEYLTFQCTSIPIEDVNAQDFIESLTDLTCEVCLDPKNLSPTTDIVVNGNHSAGEPVLNIDASTTIRSGMVLPIGGKQYFVLYTIGGTSVTKLVLHKPLASAVSDNATITPNEPVGDGTYQFVPQQRETPRPHAQETEVALNLSWTFVRQYQQI